MSFVQGDGVSSSRPGLSGAASPNGRFTSFSNSGAHRAADHFARGHPPKQPLSTHALARQFAESANNLPNANSTVHAGPSKSPRQFTLLPFQAPVGAQRMVNMLRRWVGMP